MGSRSKKKANSKLDIVDIEVDEHIHTTEFGHMKNRASAGGAMIWYCPNCDILQPFHVSLYCYFCGKQVVRRHEIKFNELRKRRSGAFGKVTLIKPKVGKD